MDERKKHDNDDGRKNVPTVYLITADGKRVDITKRSTTTASHSARPAGADGSVKSQDDVLNWKRMAAALAWNLRNCVHPSYDHTVRREILDDFDEMMRDED
jgi:hypothetical protein